MPEWITNKLSRSATRWVIIDKQTRRVTRKCLSFLRAAEGGDCPKCVEVGKCVSEYASECVCECASECVWACVSVCVWVCVWACVFIVFSQYQVMIIESAHWADVLMIMCYSSGIGPMVVITQHTVTLFKHSPFFEINSACSSPIITTVNKHTRSLTHTHSHTLTHTHSHTHTRTHSHTHSHTCLPLHI